MDIHLDTDWLAILTRLAVGHYHGRRHRCCGRVDASRHGVAVGCEDWLLSFSANHERHR